MNESVGSALLFNLVLVFVIILSGLFIGSLAYTKAFKVNSRILDIIEKFEGYNNFAYDEIGSFLNTMGYVKGNTGCNVRSHGADIVSSQNGNNDIDDRYDYCVYYHENDGKGINGKNSYYNYSVVTYIYVDLPFIRQLKIPVYTKGERTYKFNGTQNPIAS